MSVNDSSHDPLLDRLLAGDLDGLDPAEIDALEQRLNMDAQLAARLAGVTPVAEAELRNVPPVSDAEWSQVWQTVETAPTRAAAGRRILRLWHTAAAAAACLLLALTWNARQPATPEAWPVTWADSVEIEEVDVTDGGVPFVLSVGTQKSVTMIWVLGES